MNILSLFDGISVARFAIEKADIKIGKYYASEIDKYALQVSAKNYPDNIKLGDVKEINKINNIMSYGRKNKDDFIVSGMPLNNIDLLIGGSPCQDLSIAKSGREGLSGERSGLFWEYVRILNEVKPRYFILENVNSMPKEAKAIISEALGVEPIMINAALVSAQSRKRLFWIGKLVNGQYEQVKIPQPKDREIYLKDILESGFTPDDKSLTILNSYAKKNYQDYAKRKNGGQMVFKDKPIRIGHLNKGGQGDRIYSTDGKSVCLSANGGGREAKTGLYLISSTQKHATISQYKSSPLVAAMGTGCGHVPMLSKSKNLKDYVRKLTPIECERLQSLDDDFTKGISNTQRYKCLGNAFNAEVIKYIIENLIELKN